jgi:methylamine dehydrogenase accessory protein MauD
MLAMRWVTLAAQLLLGAVFAAAGVGKLADRNGSRQAAADFGVPKRAGPAIALMLPFVELSIAALLITSRSARWGAGAALAMLCVFTVAIAISLVRGRKPNCHCFGQLHSSPIGWSTILRNGSLALIAVFVLWRGDNHGMPPFSVEAGFTTTRIAPIIALVAFALAVVEGWLLLNIVSQQGRFLVRIEALEIAAGVGPGTGLPVGQQAPAFDLRALSGDRISLARLLSSNRPLMLVFTSPDCAPCDALLPDVAHWQRDICDLTVAVIGRGSPETNRAKADQHGLHTILLQKEREVAEAYHVEGTPAALLIGVEGRIASRIAYGGERIEALLKHALGVPASARGAAPFEIGGDSDAPEAHPLAVGQSAPALALADLDGNPVNLAGDRRTPTVVLFWSPECVFCQRMLPDLKQWEKHRSARSVDLLIISTGTVEANRAMGLVSTIVIDSDRTAMRRFGTSGTPTAVLLDTSGRIVSSVATGAKEVMALAATPHEFIAT